MKGICSSSIADMIIKSNSSLNAIFKNIKKFKTRTKFISGRINKIKERKENIGDILESQLDELKQFSDDYFNESSIDIDKISGISLELYTQIRDKHLRELSKNQKNKL